MVDWLDFGIAVLALFISVGSFALSWFQRPESQIPIETIIEDEARLTREGDVDGTVKLFTDDAVMRQRHPDQSWIGKDRIRERYQTFRDNTSFSKLEHLHIFVKFDPTGKGATATSSSQGKFRWKDQEEQSIDTVNGEIWSLVRINGKWKIKNVTFLNQDQLNMK